MLFMRKKSNAKNKPVKERLSNIQRWHRRYRKRFQEPKRYEGHVVLVSGWQQGAPVTDTRINVRLREPKDDTTFGLVQLTESFNADQVPKDFVSGQTQASDRPKAQRIQVPRQCPALEKRQRTVEPIIGLRGKKIRMRNHFPRIRQVNFGGGERGIQRTRGCLFPTEP